MKVDYFQLQMLIPMNRNQMVMKDQIPMQKTAMVMKEGMVHPHTKVQTVTTRVTVAICHRPHTVMPAMVTPPRRKSCR